MNSALLQLLHLSDPTLPIGGFSHSAGLETYVQQGTIKDTASATAFCMEMLDKNLCYTDAALAGLAYTATVDNDLAALIHLDDVCNAVKLPIEMRTASIKLGLRLRKIFQPHHDNATLNDYSKAVKEQHAVGHYCISFGILAAMMGIDKRDAITGFYYNAAAGFVTNAVKLVPLSQQSGQGILLQLIEAIPAMVEKSMAADEAMIGICCTGFDISSMQHERLYSRLYMS